jgi:hypothetical protein
VTPYGLFTVLPPRTKSVPGVPGTAYLIRDNWDDWFEFTTMFTLVVIDEHGVRHDPGSVKFGEFGMKEGQRRPAVPEEPFDDLGSAFFSVGQDEDYYATLNKLTEELRGRITSGLRDLAADLPLLDRALNERVTQLSLLRSVKEETIRGRFHRLVRGDADLSTFDFEYAFPAPVPGLVLAFKVQPNSHPPTNIHVLIGRNGVGKTRCLYAMTRALVHRDAAAVDVGAFMAPDPFSTDDSFSSLVSVSFSAFDPFEPLWESASTPHAIPYSYVGLRRPPPRQKQLTEDELRKERPPKTYRDLTAEFGGALRKCRMGPKRLRWLNALETLDADPLFREASLSSVFEEDDEDESVSHAEATFGDLSSGHKVVLLTITRLVESVDERTLVLLDEPEAHLHPPLLSAFIRTLSNLLVQRNGVAIIATHSPVVLQEVPRTCVWMLRRSGRELNADRPSIETFGENVGILTSEVFGLEVTDSGFHKMIEQAVEGAESYESVLERFGSQLGAEGRAIARALVATRAVRGE